MSNEIKVKAKKIVKIFGNILVIVSLFFLIKKMLDLDIDYKKYFYIANIVKLIPVLLIFTLLMIIQFIPWKIIIYSMTGVKLVNLNVCRIFVKSSLMKYIPGNIFQYVGRVGLASENERLNIANVVTSVLIDSVALILAAIIDSLIGARKYVVALFRNNVIVVSYGLIIILAIASCYLIIRDKIFSFLKKRNIHVTPKLFGAFVISVLFYAVSFIIQGLLFTLVIYVLSGNSYFDLSAVISGAYVISWIAGYITPGASGGIGIRETVLCMLLGNIVSGELVILAIFIFRIINICGDFFAFSIVETISGLYRKIKKHD